MAFSTFKCFATSTTLKFQNIFITPKTDPTINLFLSISLSPGPDNHWLSFCETFGFCFFLYLQFSQHPKQIRAELKSDKVRKQNT